MHNSDVTPLQWRVLAPMLPPNPRIGRPYRDHRQVINGILWRIKNGAPWHAIPNQYGPWQTCYDRFRRWEKDGTWLRLLHALQSLAAPSIAWDEVALDSTHVKVHRSASGAPHPMGDEAIGRSRGGATSKLHLVADQHARPLAVHITAGHASDAANLLPTLNAIHVRQANGRVKRRPARLLLDRAYGARACRQQLRALHVQVVCPERLDHRQARLRKGAKGGRPPAFNPGAYKLRNTVERLANRLKDFRAIATRYDKHATSYQACVLVAMIILWL